MQRTLAACLLLSSVSLAQEPPAKVATGRFGFDVTSQYFFRGLLQEDQGVIAQPKVELGFDLYQGDSGDSLHGIDMKFGLWNSLHDGPTGGSGGIWYESNFYFGFDAHVGERLDAGIRYSAYTNPNRVTTNTNNANLRHFSKQNRTVEELIFLFDYDDRGQWFESLDSGLRPSLVLAFELSGQRDVATNGHSGIYAGLGIEPEFAVGQLGEANVSLRLPVTVGLSLGDYYERATGGNDDFFGYLDLGGELAMPLSFLPAKLGPWDGFVGLHLLLLGDNNRSRNGGDSSELIFSFGCSTVF